jgi:hypothetical protein
MLGVRSSLNAAVIVTPAYRDVTSGEGGRSFNETRFTDLKAIPM